MEETTDTEKKTSPPKWFSILWLAAAATLVLVVSTLAAHEAVRLVLLLWGIS